MHCNACGSTNVIEGEIRSESGSIGVFIPKDKSYFKKMFGIGGSKISSFACMHCNNLQFTVNFSEEERSRYVKFEGQQPGILERLNEETDLKK